MKHVRFKTSRHHTHSRKYDSIFLSQYPSDTIPLWVADMDIEVDARILEGLHRYLDEKILGYNLIDSTYSQSIVDYLHRRHQCDIMQHWIMTTPNVVSSMNACILTLTQPNDAVLIIEPIYTPFFKSVESTQRKVIFSSLRRSSCGYVMDFEDMESKITKHKIKMVLFCSPHNPVGRVWRIDELEQFLILMKKHDVKVVSDEIHMDFILKGHKHIPLIRLDDSIIMLMSASKTFNLASAHVSQIIVKDDKIRKKLMKLYHQLGLFHHLELGLRATIIAYSKCDDYIDELCEVIESNVKLVDALLKDSPFKVLPIEGTYLMWIDITKLNLTSCHCQKRLIHEARVWLNDGSTFGPTGEGYVRLNVATSPEQLNEACQRLLLWVKEYTHESEPIK